jgi:hypothetical protein
MEKKIFGRWSDYEGMRNDWFEQKYDCEKGEYKPYEYPAEFPTEDELLFASYGGGSYEGDASIVWKRDGKFYEAHGSHCSCYGLEGQFSAEETTLEALAAKGKKNEESYYYFLSDHDQEAYDAYWNLIDSLQ